MSCLIIHTGQVYTITANITRQFFVFAVREAWPSRRNQLRRASAITTPRKVGWCEWARSNIMSVISCGAVRKLVRIAFSGAERHFSCGLKSNHIFAYVRNADYQ